MQERIADRVMIEALDQARSIRHAARIVGCHESTLRFRGTISARVREALARNGLRRKAETREDVRGGPPARALTPLELAEVAPEIGIAVRALQRILSDPEVRASARVVAAKALLAHGQAKLERYGEASLRTDVRLLAGRTG